MSQWERVHDVGSNHTIVLSIAISRNWIKTTMKWSHSSPTHWPQYSSLTHSRLVDICPTPSLIWLKHWHMPLTPSLTVVIPVHSWWWRLQSCLCHFSWSFLWVNAAWHSTGWSHQISLFSCRSCQTHEYTGYKTALTCMWYRISYAHLTWMFEYLYGLMWLLYC